MVAGIFVSAAIALYDPPAALRPQIVIAINRPPRSRAVLAATRIRNSCRDMINIWGLDVDKTRTCSWGITPHGHATCGTSQINGDNLVQKVRTM